MTERAPFVYLDTNVFIRAFESAEPEASALVDMFLWLRDRPGIAITSELTWAELLAPSKLASSIPWSEKEPMYRGLLVESRLIPLIPVTFDILDQTTRLRVQHPQKLPDAIHIVTAYSSGCVYFMSNDRDSERLPFNLRRLTPDAAGVSTLMKAPHG